MLPSHVKVLHCTDNIEYCHHVLKYIVQSIAITCWRSTLYRQCTIEFCHHMMKYIVQTVNIFCCGYRQFSHITFTYQLFQEVLMNFQFSVLCRLIVNRIAIHITLQVFLWATLLNTLAHANKHVITGCGFVKWRNRTCSVQNKDRTFNTLE